MSIDTATPRTRRAVIAGAVGGLLATAAGLAKAPVTRAAAGDPLLLETTNNTESQTELIANTSSAGLRVLSTGIGLQGWGDIGVDAYGETIAVNAIGDGAEAPAGVAWSRASSTGQLGWSTDGNESTPTVPAKTGVYGLAGQDADARGVLGRSPDGQGVRGESTNGIGVVGASESGPGVLGVGPVGALHPEDVRPGVHGTAGFEPGVFGYSSFGFGVRGASASGDGVLGLTNGGGSDQHVAHSPGAGVHGHGGQAGVLGTHDSGFGVQATSVSAPALYASNGSATAAAIVAEGDPGTAIHGHANDGGPTQQFIPDSPALTGVFGSAFGAGTGIAASAENGHAIDAVSTAGKAIRGRGQLVGVIGESSGGNAGVVGFSGAGAAPAGPAKTGVYGTAGQDANSRGVHGMSPDGRGVYGSSSAGIGVRGYSANGVAGSFGTSGLKTGLALQTVGRVRFDKSVGIATIPAGANSVVVTPGMDLASTSAVVATLQGDPGGSTTVQRVAVNAAADTFTIYLTANSTANVKVAWHVFG